MRRTRTRISAVLIMGMGLSGLARQASAQFDLRDFWGSSQPTPLEAVVKSPDSREAPTHVRVALQSAETGEAFGRAVVTLGPEIYVPASCPPVSSWCSPVNVDGLAPLTDLDRVPALAMDANGERLIWGFANRPTYDAFGGLMHLNPETGEACPVCTVDPTRGAYISEITVARGPRTVLTGRGDLLVLPPGAIWAFDPSPLASGTGQSGTILYVEPASGTTYRFTDTWYSDDSLTMHAIAAGAGGTIYGLFTQLAFGSSPADPTLTFLNADSRPVGAGLGTLVRADGVWFGRPTAMLYRPGAISGFNGDLLIAVSRGNDDRPWLYRVPLDGFGMPLSYMISREDMYPLVIEGMSLLEPGAVPILEALAQREGSGNEFTHFLSELIDLESLFEVYSCERLPLPQPCVQQDLISALQNLREALRIGNFVSAKDTAIGIGGHVDGCKNQGSPDGNDWIKDCSGTSCAAQACNVQKSAFAKAGQAFQVAELAASP